MFSLSIRLVLVCCRLWFVAKFPPLCVCCNFFTFNCIIELLGPAMFFFLMHIKARIPCCIFFSFHCFCCRANSVFQLWFREKCNVQPSEWLFRLKIWTSIGLVCMINWRTATGGGIELLQRNFLRSYMKSVVSFRFFLYASLLFLCTVKFVGTNSFVS